MHVLIVGCGYVGERAARQLVASGQQVSAVTRSAERAEQFARAGWNPVIADVMDVNSLAQLPVADAVLYAVGYDRSAGRDKRDVYVNGLSNVLTALSGRTRRLVYLSSTSVYGQAQGEWVQEDSPTAPTAEGGQICLEAEQTVWGWRDSRSDLDSVCVLRLAGLYGPGRMLARGNALQQGEPMSGRGDAWLNLIHGDDAAALAIRAATIGRDRAIYLGVDDEPVTRASFYGELASLLNAPAPQFTGLTDGPGRNSETGLNKRCRNQMTRGDLPMSLQYPTFREGLRSAVSG